MAGAYGIRTCTSVGRSRSVWIDLVTCREAWLLRTWLLRMTSWLRALSFLLLSTAVKS